MRFGGNREQSLGLGRPGDQRLSAQALLDLSEIHAVGILQAGDHAGAVLDF